MYQRGLFPGGAGSGLGEMEGFLHGLELSKDVTVTVCVRLHKKKVLYGFSPPLPSDGESLRYVGGVVVARARKENAKEKEKKALALCRKLTNLIRREASLLYLP